MQILELMYKQTLLFMSCISSNALDATKWPYSESIPFFILRSSWIVLFEVTLPIEKLWVCINF